jgi:hypothetical protein
MTAGEVKWRHVFGDKGSRRGRGEQKRERHCEGNTVATRRRAYNVQEEKTCMGK